MYGKHIQSSSRMLSIKQQKKKGKDFNKEEIRSKPFFFFPESDFIFIDMSNIYFFGISYFPQKH